MNYKANRFAIPKFEFLKSVSREDFWFPEELSIWFYLKSYQGLSPNARRRYNQLYAMAVNEIFSLFESGLITPILTKLSKRNSEDSLYNKAIENFCDEEDKHAEMFRLFNQAVEPEYYKDDPFFFSKRADSIGFSLIKLIKKFPSIFAVWIWIVIYFEERTLIYSKYYLKKEQAHLSPVFREIHKLHMLEEVYHVQLDEVIIDRNYNKLHPLKKKLAAYMFKYIIKSYSSPRRMSQTIAKTLIVEMPEERKAIDACLRELPQMKNNMKYQKLFLSEEAVPRTWKLMRKHPEMSGVLNQLRGISEIIF